MTFVPEYCTIYTDMILDRRRHDPKRPRARQRVRNAKNTGTMRNIDGAQPGFLLIELLVALAILAVIAVAFLSALTTGYRGLLLAHQKTMAESLVRTELERIREAPYPIADEVKSDRGYDISIVTSYVQPGPSPEDPVTGTPSPTGMQAVTVSITHQGKLLLTTATHKADR